jgi:hypothetical protein
MKHPVLRIKKGSTVFDDHEADMEVRRLRRLSLDTLRAARRPRSRKQRAGLSTVSLLIVAIGAFLVIRQAPEVPRVSFQGWQVILRATPHDELIIVGVTFIAEAGAAMPLPASGTDAPEKASIRIVMTGTEGRLDLGGALDRSPMTLRGELPRSAKARKVKAEVSIGSESRTLWVATPRAKTR